MDAELGEHEDALTTRRQRLDREAAAMDEELALLRARFIGLEESLGELAQLQQRVALLRARRRQLDEDETVAAELLAEVTDLTCRLQEGDFALDARAVQADAEASLVDLAFDPDRLAALEDHVGNGVEVDADEHLNRTVIAAFQWFEFGRPECIADNFPVGSVDLKVRGGAFLLGKRAGCGKQLLEVYLETGRER